MMSAANIRVDHATPSSRIGLTIFAASFVLLAAAPFWGDRLSLRLLAEMYSFVALALALVVAILALIVWLLRSRYGLALTAIIDNDLAASSNGIDVGRVKLVIYV